MDIILAVILVSLAVASIALIFCNDPVVGVIFMAAGIFMFFAFGAPNTEEKLKENPEYRVILESFTSCSKATDLQKCQDAEIKLVKTERQAMTLVMLFHELRLDLSSNQLQAVRQQIIQYQPELRAHPFAAVAINGGNHSPVIEAQQQ